MNSVSDNSGAAAATTAPASPSFDAPLTASGPVGWARHLWASWRSMRWLEFGGFMALGLLYGAVDLTSLVDAKQVEHPWQLFWRLLLSPPVCTLVVLLAWLPADRSGAGHRWRGHRLALGAAAGSVLAVPAMWAVAEVMGWPSYNELCLPKCPPDFPLWQRFLGDFLAVLLPCALAIALIEMLRRRWRSEAMLQALLHEQAALGRQAMAARLAAMQAQVEPRFLFDVLVDVQQQYAQQQSDAAAEQLERLIHHLRVALPRLRDQNVTTLDAEAALLGSYLAVRQGLAHCPVQFDDELPAELRAAPLPAMLLLPLLQRALRLAPDSLPQRVALSARRDRTGLRISLGVSTPGLCGDDADLSAQRQRLQVLAGDSAQLHCEDATGATRFTLELPA